MENFRKGLVDLNTREKIPVTPLAFIMKALVNAMKKYPNFNSSLDPENEEVVYKKYFHIGIAVDTPHGLMVPKIRNVDQKDILTLGKELRKISKQWKELKLIKKNFWWFNDNIAWVELVEVFSHQSLICQKCASWELEKLRQSKFI